MTSKASRSGATRILLIGPPNTGKSSLFNALTGFDRAMVNYPGASVDAASGRLTGTNIEIFDTPGTVSLVPRSDDEQITYQLLSDQDRPIVPVVVLDACQLARQLPIVAQIKRIGHRPTVILTKNDLAIRDGRGVDARALSRYLDLVVVEANPRSGKGINAAREALAKAIPRRTSMAELSMIDGSRHEDFAWADRISAHVGTDSTAGKSTGRSDRIDAWLLHPIVGPIVFVGVMSGLFWAIFAAAAPLMDSIDGGFALLSSWLAEHLPDNTVGSLIVEGIVPGIGAVLVFVPQIAILFLLIAFLEDSGYLARGAALVDRPLSAIGLNGRSFLPLLSGFSCAIPAVLAARNVPGRTERLLTVLVIPLMVCSARLPVYGLILGLLLPRGDAWIGGMVMVAIYLGSIALSSILALVVGKLFRLKPSPAGFQIELPEWRRPTIGSVLRPAFRKTREYLFRAGPIIFLVTVVFWAGMSYPDPERPILRVVGDFMQPAFEAMGFDWRVGMAIIASFAAREVFVASLAVIFAIEDPENTTRLLDVLSQATHATTGEPLFTVGSLIGLIVFFQVSLQCLTTVAVVRREMNSPLFAMAQFVGFLVLAWLMAVLVAQTIALAS